MAVHPNQLVFYAGGECLEKYGTLVKSPVLSVRQVVPTFTRSHASSAVSGLYSAATNGRLRKAEADTPRVSMLDVDGDGDFTDLALKLEGARTNKALDSEDIASGAAWSSNGTPVLGADAAVAPDGTATGDTIEDDDGTAREGREQSITIADDTSTWCASVFVKDSGGPIALLRMKMTGGTTLNFDVQVDPSTGDVDTSASPDTVIRAGSESVGGSWYRVWVVGANNGTGNTTMTVGLFPAWTGSLGGADDNSQTGTHRWWGVQVENATFPSSYIPTTSAAVTRNAENFSAPFLAAPQEMTFYVKVRDWANAADGLASTNPSLLRIGGPGLTDDPRLFVLWGSSSVRAGYDSGSATSDATRSGSFSAGDLVEVRAVLAADGGITVGLSVNEGAETTASASGASLSSTSVWSENTIHLGSDPAGGNQGFIDLLAAKVAVGVHSLADMRAAF